MYPYSIHFKDAVVEPRGFWARRDYGCHWIWAQGIPYQGRLSETIVYPRNRGVCCYIRGVGTRYP